MAKIAGQSDQNGEQKQGEVNLLAKIEARFPCLNKVGIDLGIEFKISILWEMLRLLSKERKAGQNTRSKSVGKSSRQSSIKSGSDVKKRRRNGI